MITKELFYLALTALLNTLLWVPVVIGYVRNRGLLKPSDYVKAPESVLPDWVNRANRAHMNAVENLSPIAAIVLTSAVISYSTGLTQILAATYFWGRLVHAVVHISGFNKFRARTVIFGIANTACVVYAMLVIMKLWCAWCGKCNI